MANRVVDDAIVIADTVTKLGPECAGRVVLGGSHGGIYATYLACKAGGRGVILNDAGIGRDRAGVGGGAYCDDLAIPFAAVDTMSARIGNGESMAGEGVISFVNRSAAALGVAVGMGALAAARLMAGAKRSDRPVPAYAEARKELPAGPGRRMIVLMDSISLVTPADVGRIVISGSHGGTPGTDPATALAVDAFAGLFNDAGGGRDGAGMTRLAPLDRRGIVAATVAAASARIGDGESTYRDGVLSHINDRARAAGAEIGMTARAFVDALAGQ